MTAQLTVTKDFPTVDASSKSGARPRMAYIDNLRILLIILVIVHHLAIGYGAPGDWDYREAREPGIIALVLMTLQVATDQAFFMGMFFMVASYFTPRSYDRKGAGRFLLDRCKRLGLPFLAYVLVINPVLQFVLARYNGFEGTTADFFSGYFHRFPGLPVGPLWFVQSLLIFSVLYALWRRFFSPTPVVRETSSRVPGNKQIAAFALVLGLITFIIRIWVPVGVWISAITIAPAQYTQYAALFVVGTIAYRRDWFNRLPASAGKSWARAIPVLIVLLPASLVVGGALDGNVDPFMGGMTWQSLAYSLWEQFMGMAMIITLLIWFRTRFNGQGRLGKNMSATAYTAYLIHAPLIISLAMLLSGLTLPTELKYLLAAPLAVALTFAIANAVRRLPLARDIL